MGPSSSAGQKGLPSHTKGPAVGVAQDTPGSDARTSTDAGGGRRPNTGYGSAVGRQMRP